MDQDTQTGNTDFWIREVRKGNFEAAWEFSDNVLKARAGKPCWHWPRHFQYIWDGTPLEDKVVLVRCYHGLGDTIQFIRYAPLVKVIAKKLIVWAQPALIPLLETVHGIDQLLPLHDRTPEVEYDVDVESMELPHIFRTTLETIPSTIPYIHIDPVTLPGDKDKPAVGLVWKGGDWNEDRSVPFELLEPLFKLRNIRFFILQQNPRAVGWNEKLGIHLYGLSLYEDARIIKALDLLISVDTMTAHLGGALGTPVWNLLQAEADWRWMENRDDSPWYPAMHLFRQKQKGDWEGVIRSVMQELSRLFIHNASA